MILEEELVDDDALIGAFETAQEDLAIKLENCTGCYASEYYRETLGETWAVSAEKAISNIRYRLRQKGELLPDDLGDSEGMGFVHYTLEAVPA